MTEGALSDLLVIDLSRDLAGGYCTKWLVDLGAEVIKIEPPGVGDPVRHMDAAPGAAIDLEAGPTHLYLDAGKKSVSLALETPTGQALLRRLCTQADLLVEDTFPCTLDALGLGWSQLAADNNRLIYVSITPFGQTGPDRDRPATELTLAALSGSLAVRSFAGERPIMMGGNQGMYIGGRIAFVSAMGALLHRDRTGLGQRVDVSLLEAMAGNDMAAPTTYSYTGIAKVPAMRANARGGGGAGRYPCKDGFVDVTPGIGGLKKLAALLGDPGLAEHELFRNHALRAQRAAEFDRTFMEPYLSTHTRAEIVEAAQALGMPFSYVLRPDELLQEPHLVARGFFVTIDHPQAGTITMPGSPVRFSDSPTRTGAAPQLGADNAGVLEERLSVSPEELRGLRDEGVIGR